MHTISIRLMSLTSALVLSCAMAPSIVADKCEVRAGSATGLTRGFAEYEAFLIIRQVSGNWPIQTDRISKPDTTCTQKNLLWHCRAKAKICKG